MSDSRTVLIIGDYAGDLALLLRELERRNIRAELRQRAIQDNITLDDKREDALTVLVEEWMDLDNRYRRKLDERKRLDEQLERCLQQVMYIERPAQAWQYDPAPEPVVRYTNPKQPPTWQTEYG